MVESWFPWALLLSVGGGFALWWSLTDYERARYYPAILGIPVSVFAVAGLFNLNSPFPTLQGWTQVSNVPVSGVYA